MRTYRRAGGALVLLVLLVAGCSLFPDVIEGSWQQESVDGVDAVLVTVVTFTDTEYTCSVAGVIVNTGTWTRSSMEYTLNGSMFGFISTSVDLAPAFSNSNNTLTYTDDDGYVQIYNRQ